MAFLNLNYQIPSTLVVPVKLNTVAFRVADVENGTSVLVLKFSQSLPFRFYMLMNGTHTFNVKDKFLSSFVRFACAMEAQLASTGIEAKKPMFWERLILLRY